MQEFHTWIFQSLLTGTQNEIVYYFVLRDIEYKFNLNYYTMEKVTIGTKVNRLGISRLSVGEGQTCRAILIDHDPRMKHIAYDDIHKRRVEVDQDMCIKYGLRPSPTFFYLVAKLNTDLSGNVIGDRFTIEYLQLSENLNNELSDQILEQGIPKSLQMTKIKKSVNGKDYSYIKVVPSQRGFEDNKDLWDKINKFCNDENAVNACWAMIDSGTSLTKEQYIALLASEKEGNQNAQGEQNQIAGPQGQAPKQIAAKSDQSTSASVMPAVPENFANDNDFGGGDEFNDGF